MIGMIPIKMIYLHLYVLVSTMFGVFIFLHGFFPMKNTDATVLHSHEHVRNVSNAAEGNATIGRLIFMVIDALRSDFILHVNSTHNMPYLTSLVKAGEACVFTGKARTPTVTMPRIKAMVTGTVPGFVDVALNLGSPQLFEESFISNLVNAGHKAIFYGDDTWLRLFPNTFTRSEGTTSFFVADYTEVDVNVTRHLARELAQSDWSLMVLHYLGLDHIGHLVGPRSPLVPPKLREMDDVIKQIHRATPKGKLPQLLLVCGDHGMKDTGSHGGASDAETHVAVAAVGIPCESRSSSTIAQVDLAPTLSLLLGLPEPVTSVGALIPELIKILPRYQRIDALFKNTAHLSALLGSSLSAKQESLYLEAQFLHQQWLNFSSDDQLLERAEFLYRNAALEMSSTLANAHGSFDIHALIVSGMLVFQSLILLLVSVSGRIALCPDVGNIFVLTMSLLGLNAAVCSASTASPSAMCKISPPTLLVQGITAILLSYNSYVIWSNTRKFRVAGDATEKFLLLGTLLHALSLGASSLVEEEHQVWYFLWASLLIVMMVTRQNLISLLANLVVHRASRKFNQTGDKWAALPDFEDWLSEQKIVISVIFAFALFLLCFYFVRQRQSNFNRLVFIVMFFLLYLYRSAIQGVVFPLFQEYLSHQGWIEARVYGTLLAVISVKCVMEAVRKPSAPAACTALINSWILAVAIMRRPHDLLLVSVQLLASETLSRVLHASTDALVISHTWLGWVAYFYQGNSNSLASIDVAAGYVGLLDYQPVLVGMFLAAHTYSAPVLSLFLLLSKLVENNTERVREVLRGLRLYSVLRLLPVCVYLGVAALQREHLFVWSVFAPKLLYEASALLVSILSLMPCYLCLLPYYVKSSTN